MLFQILAVAAANTDAHARKIPAAQAGDNGAHAVVRARAAFLADTEGADGQFDVVIQHDEPLHRALIEMQQRLDTIAGEIHIGGRFHQNDPFTLIDPLAIDAAKAPFDDADMQLVGNHIQRLKARVVTRALIEQARVAESGDDKHTFHSNKILIQRQPILARSCKNNNLALTNSGAR
ncbi:hypothetical protein SDC9_145677 [bioreactor metagenome]|uniref:Uncharacterized protein n=1 Tax=bioreactor metagenome TaxID=1076179 RepID=A0A645EAZ7_9ZZZZ